MELYSRPGPYYGNNAVLLAKYLHTVGFSVQFKPVSSLGYLLFKPTFSADSDNWNKTSVVYVLNCDNCNIRYIGETTRLFSIRLKEHVRDITRNIADNKLSAISLHSRNSGHCFSFDKFIDRDNVYRNLMFKEDLFISCNENLCNVRSTDRNSVSPIWLCLRNLLRI